MNAARGCMLGLALAAACFRADDVIGLPCANAAQCGPEHACVFGYCRAGGETPDSICTDEEVEHGELCYFGEDADSLVIVGNPTYARFAQLDGQSPDDVLIGTDSKSKPLHAWTGGEAGLTLYPLTLELGPLFQSLGLGSGANPPPYEILAQGFGVQPDGTVAGVAIASIDPAIGGKITRLVTFTITGHSIVLALLGGEDLLPETAGLVVGNFDGMGTLDVVLVADANAPLQGTKLAPAAIIHQFAGATAGVTPVETIIGGRQGIVVRDVDDDGRDDIVSVDVADAGGRVFVAYGRDDLDAPFSEPLAFAIDGSPSANLGDVDADGRLDLVVALRDVDAVWVYFAQGMGMFETDATVFDVPASYGVAVADLDEDALPDLVLGTADEHVVALSGFGAEFGAPIELLGSGARSIETADLDGAPGLDLLLLDAHGAAVVYAEPSGTE